jgi:hypothetical protein
MTYHRPGYEFSDIAFQSYFRSAFGTAGRLFEWPLKLKGQAQKHFAADKKIREYLAGDHYALLPQPRGLDEWAWWQFHDPESGRGFVRMKSGQAVRRLLLHGLDANAGYELTDIYSDRKWAATGKELLNDGFEFHLREMSSQALIYRKKA